MPDLDVRITSMYPPGVQRTKTENQWRRSNEEY